MSFRLSRRARAYFTQIDDHSKTGTFDSVWDKYYLCLMVGFKERKLGEEPPQEDIFINEFIQDYRDQRFQIISGLVLAEAKRQGIPLDDEIKLRDLMLELLDHLSVTALTDDGHKLMNRYAEGGFQIIQERIPDPSEFDAFLRGYYEAFIKGA